MGYVLKPGGKWSKDYVVLDLGTASENYDSKSISVLTGGDASCKVGQPLFPFPASRVRDILLEFAASSRATAGV